MPRKPRIHIPGYYHVINRGVNREDIFLDEDDKDKFLELLDISRETYQLTVHSFCILDNHYHLLVETSRDNLSLAIRYVNSRYAIYFNKKLQRIGPLWQGRFKSWYVHDEDYLWLLLRYIEMNPVKAGITQVVGEYPDSTSYYVINKLHPAILSGSILFQKDIRQWLLPLEETDWDRLADFQSTRIEQKNGDLEVKKKVALGEYFPGDQTLQQRNFAIHQAFIDGYKQSEVARYLALSAVAVSRIIDREKQKKILFRKVRDKGLLWSYASDLEYSPDKQSLLLETVLKFSDLADIRLLIKLFGLREVRRIWESRMRFDVRFKKLNYFLARIFFNLDVEADDFNESRSIRAEKLRLLAG